MVHGMIWPIETIPWSYSNTTEHLKYANSTIGFCLVPAYAFLILMVGFTTENIGIYMDKQKNPSISL